MDWQILCSMVGIVLILVLLIWGSKWVTKRYSTASSSSKHIKIIDRTMLGQDKSIILADICDNKYIIGVSGQQITLLKDLGEIEIAIEEKNSQDDIVTVFSDILKKQMSLVTDKFKGKGPQSDKNVYTDSNNH